MKTEEKIREKLEEIKSHRKFPDPDADLSLTDDRYPIRDILRAKAKMLEWVLEDSED